MDEASGVGISGCMTDWGEAVIGDNPLGALLTAYEDEAGLRPVEMGGGGWRALPLTCGLATGVGPLSSKSGNADVAAVIGTAPTLESLIVMVVLVLLPTLLPLPLSL